MIDLVRLSLQELAGRTTATQHEALRDRIRDYIGQHLRDPDLSLDHIAQVLNCSKRHLHNAFAEKTTRWPTTSCASASRPACAS